MKNNPKKMERTVEIQKIAEDGLTKNTGNFWKHLSCLAKIGTKCTNMWGLVVVLRQGHMHKSILIN
jgi:hypothetical protein